MLSERDEIELDIDYVKERHGLFVQTLGEHGNPKLGKAISKREREQVRRLRVFVRTRMIAPRERSWGGGVSCACGSSEERTRVRAPSPRAAARPTDDEPTDDERRSSLRDCAAARARGQPPPPQT